MRARVAAAAQARLVDGAGDPAFFDAKLKTARLYTDDMLPWAGADSTLALAKGDF